MSVVRGLSCNVLTTIFCLQSCFFVSASRKKKTEKSTRFLFSLRKTERIYFLWYFSTLADSYLAQIQFLYTRKIKWQVLTELKPRYFKDQNHATAATFSADLSTVVKKIDIFPRILAKNGLQRSPCNNYQSTTVRENSQTRKCNEKNKPAFTQLKKKKIYLQ